ncbi:MAG TPA: hypothetical protein IAB01_06355 [Candidatus Avidesulfovibrio excrementigallinarum]|nr:hypothetical protein [Candidatus Avidesulfovibrio excrementigallinarum]
MNAFIRRCFCLPALAALLVTGCSGMSTVLDEDEFHLMGRRFTPQLYKHGILDAEGGYRTFPLLQDTFPEPAGKNLFRLMDLGFLQSLTRRHDKSFAATCGPDDEVTFDDRGFVIRRATETVTVRLLGSGYWNDDRKPDWFVLCRIENIEYSRDYYLVLTQIERAPLIPELLGACRTEGDPAGADRVGRRARPASAGTPAGTHEYGRLSDVEAGTRTVVPAPGAPGPKTPASPLEEHPLGR